MVNVLTHTPYLLQISLKLCSGYLKEHSFKIQGAAKEGIRVDNNMRRLPSCIINSQSQKVLQDGQELEVEDLAVGIG